MMRLLLIHTRSSGSPSAARSSVPVTLAEPVDPTATAVMIRPPSARAMCENVVTVPIDPVYGRRRAVSVAVSKLSVQAFQGFAPVHSPGSQTPVSHGIAYAGSPPCHTSWTLSECPPSDAA